MRLRAAPAVALTVFALALGTQSDAASKVSVTLLSTAVSPAGPGLTSVACMSAGNCVASGYSAHHRATIQDERHGTWSAPIDATASLGKINFSILNAVSCFESGCVGFGRYSKGIGAPQIRHFTISYAGGRWGKAIPVALSVGTARLFQEFSISCSDQRDCVAVGTLQYSGEFAKVPTYAPAVLTERAGRWSSVQPLAPKTHVVNEVSEFLDVSCPRPGDCVAVGIGTVHGAFGSIEARETGGHWSAAQRAFPANWTVLGVSCVSGPNCMVVGRMTRSGDSQAFASWGRPGHWARPLQLGKEWTFRGYSRASANLVSCQSPDTCVVAGLVDGPNPKVSGKVSVSSVAWTATETNGTWDAGTLIGYHRGALNQGQVDGLSCPPDGACAEVGQYWIENSSLVAVHGVHSFAARLNP